LEGSNDGLTWVRIDDRQNDTSLSTQGASFIFSISVEFEEEFRMIRLRQTGKNTGGHYHLIVSAIELFGVLKGLKQ
jgi:hypothetical protein